MDVTLTIRFRTADGGETAVELTADEARRLCESLDYALGRRLPAWPPMYRHPLGEDWRLHWVGTGVGTDRVRPDNPSPITWPKFIF